MAQSQFALLRSRRFLPLFLAQFLSAFNDNLFKNALVILMTYHAGAKLGLDPRLMVTAAAGVFILPFFLFSATAGKLADKYDKARLIRIIRLIEVPLLGVACIGFYLENYWLLLGVLFGAGVSAAFFGPLKYSILPDLLQEDELIGGNALVEAGTFLAILLGTILGGLLILRECGAGYVSALMLLIAAAGWVSSLGIPATAAAAGRLSVSANFVADTWQIIAAARRQKDAFLAIIGISWFWLVGFTFLAQFPVYAKDVVGADETVVTFFLTVFSVGIALGSLICNRLLKGEITAAYVPLGAFGMTAAIFALWLASPAAPAAQLMDFAAFVGHPRSLLIVASLLATAIFGGIYIVPLYALMQVRSDRASRSRTVAANNIINALFMVLAAAATMGMLRLNMAIPEIFLAIGAANIPVAMLVRRIVAGRAAARKKGSSS